MQELPRGLTISVYILLWYYIPPSQKNCNQSNCHTINLGPRESGSGSSSVNVPLRGCLSYLALFISDSAGNPNSVRAGWVNHCPPASVSTNTHAWIQHTEAVQLTKQTLHNEPLKVSTVTSFLAPTYESALARSHLFSKSLTCLGCQVN